MIIKVGTLNEVYKYSSILPESVINELIIGCSVLDCEYGENRNYIKSGGYSIVAQAKDDLCELKSIIDYEHRCCEWATRLGNSHYVSALYIFNNDFSIMLFMPEIIAPQIIIDNID